MENERSKSIEQNPTYLKSLRSNITNPNQTPEQKLGNFYVISSNKKNNSIQESERNLKSTTPELGLDEFNQSYPNLRNK